MEEKSGKGEHRPQKCVQEILGGSQYDPKYMFLQVLAVLRAVRKGFGSILKAFPSNFGKHFWYDRAQKTERSKIVPARAGSSGKQYAYSVLCIKT